MFLLTIFISFFLASPVFAADSVSGVLQFDPGAPALAADVNGVHNSLKADIIDFGSLLTVVTVTGTAGGASNVQADCTAGAYATGGGCGISTASSYTNFFKVDEPVVLGGSPTGWSCTCLADIVTDITATCTPKATVICSQ